jgi:hypothetical protein
MEKHYRHDGRRETRNNWDAINSRVLNNSTSIKMDSNSSRVFVVMREKLVKTAKRFAKNTKRSNRFFSLIY